jgi:hypothetical protein
MIRQFMRDITFKETVRMKKLLQTFGIFLVLCCGAVAQERAWKIFNPENGEWSISAPGAMKPDAAALESPSIEGTYSYNDFNGFFAVVYKDTPKHNVLWEPLKKAHFKKVRNDFVKSARGKLISEAKFSTGGETGREVYIKMPGGKMLGSESEVITTYRVERIRMFFHNRRFYLLIAVLPEKEIDTPAVNNFFNSFVVK